MNKTRVEMGVSLSRAIYANRGEIPYRLCGGGDMEDITYDVPTVTVLGGRTGQREKIGKGSLECASDGSHLHQHARGRAVWLVTKTVEEMENEMTHCWVSAELLILICMQHPSLLGGGVAGLVGPVLSWIQRVWKQDQQTGTRF